mmetsp:Transcript_13160/g.19698  ORF Transcript_13160/g.19698 Transcript_13160/m.19698 type:complete len:361 (-) Transcript_13160:2687-3769(-)
MKSSEVEDAVNKLNQHLKNRFRNKTVYPSNSEEKVSEGVRFELYHAGPSLCSHKVRFTLMEKGVPFVSHDLNIEMTHWSIPEHYHPDYVRLRLLGKSTEEYAVDFTGQSSVQKEGFDAAVVPVLVDHKLSKVIVDSSKICTYIDEFGEGPAKLIPTEFAQLIYEQIKIVDEQPHVALVYGQNPENDHRPVELAYALKGINEKKVIALKRAMRLITEDDDEIMKAYENKLKKTEAAIKFINNGENMLAVKKSLQASVSSLNDLLSKSSGPWICGDHFSLADIMWGVSLFRMRWLGVGDLFSKESSCWKVSEYADRIFARRNFREAVMFWFRAHAPSPYIEEMNTFKYKILFLFDVFVKSQL